MLLKAVFRRKQAVISINTINSEKRKKGAKANNINIEPKINNNMSLLTYIKSKYKKACLD